MFDIGAHVGNRTRVFRSLGARVAAFEPQRTCLVVLDRLCGRDGAVTILPVALGEHSGRAALHVSSDNPTLTTLSSDWIDRIDEHYGSLGIAWDREDSVEVRTLDEQIRRFGTPDFVKIDVEGFEAEVLAGLTVAVPALSFEFLPAAIENALVALRRASKIGTYRFNYSISERGKLRLKRWVDAEEMEAILAAMAPGDPSGDVYCRLVQDG